MSIHTNTLKPGQFLWSLGQTDAGPIYYIPEPHQRVLHDVATSKFLRALIAGYGAGKTLFGCIDCASAAMAYPGSRILDVSPSYKQATRTTIETYVNVFESTLGKHGKYWTFNKNEHAFRFPHVNSEIWIASGDDPRGLKGANISRARIDEPFIQPVEVYQQVIARLRLNVGPIGLLLTGTPEELNWGHELLFGEGLGSGESNRMTKAVIQASTMENTHNPASYVDAMFDNYDELMIQAYVYGQFVSLNTRQCYYNWNPNLDIHECNYDPNREIYLTFDFNVEPFCATMFHQDGHIDEGFDEIHIPSNGNVHRACDEFLAKYGKHKAGVIVTGDQAGTARSVHSPVAGYNLFSIIREKLGHLPGFEIRLPPYIAVVNRINLVNGRLCNSNGMRRLRFDKRCRHTIQDFERVKRDDSGKVDKKIDAKLTHHSDAVGYYMARFRSGAKITGLSASELR